MRDKYVTRRRPAELWTIRVARPPDEQNETGRGAAKSARILAASPLWKVTARPESRVGRARWWASFRRPADDWGRAMSMALGQDWVAPRSNGSSRSAGSSVNRTQHARRKDTFRSARHEFGITRVWGFQFKVSAVSNCPLLILIWILIRISSRVLIPAAVIMMMEVRRERGPTMHCARTRLITANNNQAPRSNKNFY